MPELARLRERTLESATRCPVCSAPVAEAVGLLPLDAESSSVAVGLNAPEDRIELRRCGRCHLVYVDPRPSAATLSEYYTTVCPRNERLTFPADHQTNRRYQRRARARWRRLSRLVQRYQPKPSSVMDIGALDGASLLPYLERGADAYAVEPGGSLRTAADPRIVFIESYEEARRRELTVDVILSTQTFEHILDPREAVGVAGGLLSASGVLVIEVPYELEHLLSLEDGEDLHGMHPEHLNLYVRESLKYLASQAGLEPLAIEAGVQIHKYGGLIPSLTLIAGVHTGKALPEVSIRDDAAAIRRLQQLMKWKGRLTGLGRW